MYLEFLLLAIDYFKTLKWSTFIYEWVLPFAIAVIVFFVIKKQISSDEAGVIANFTSNSVSLLGVLIGFSITSVTILTTSANTSVEKIKQVMTGYFRNKERISLYQLLLINFSYVIVVEIACLIFNLIYPFFLSKPVSNYSFLIGFTFAANVMFVVHVLLVNIRNITDFYFIITTNK